MGSVNSSSNLSNLLQTLQAESPQLSSFLAAPNVQAALEKASPGDLVQLSDQALQLQQVGLLFGSPDGTPSSPSPADSLSSVLLSSNSATQPDPILQALELSVGAGGTNGAASSSAPASQIANNANSLQAQEMDALFGVTPAPAVQPFLNTVG